MQMWSNFNWWRALWPSGSHSFLLAPAFRNWKHTFMHFLTIQIKIVILRSMRRRCDLIRLLSRSSLSRILPTTETSWSRHLCPSSLRRWLLLVQLMTHTDSDLRDSENQEGEGAVQAEWPPECPGPVWQWPGQWAGPGGARRPGGQQQGPHALQHHQPRQHQDVALPQQRVHGRRGKPRLLQGIGLVKDFSKLDTSNKVWVLCFLSQKVEMTPLERK